MLKKLKLKRFFQVLLLFPHHTPVAPHPSRTTPAPNRKSHLQPLLKLETSNLDLKLETSNLDWRCHNPIIWNPKITPPQNKRHLIIGFVYTLKLLLKPVFKRMTSTLDRRQIWLTLSYIPSKSSLEVSIFNSCKFLPQIFRLPRLSFNLF